MASIPENYPHLLEKADGYIDLKMFDEAEEILQSIPELLVADPHYRKLILRLACEKEEWSKAAEIAGQLTADVPEDPGFWIQFAYATRRCQNIKSARIVLLDALKRFPDEPIIPFNLACYACQDGNMPEARKFLSLAESIEPECRNMAMEDTDLEPLWEELMGDS